MLTNLVAASPLNAIRMISLFADMAGRFGMNTKEAERFFKFAVVGAIGFVVDFTIFNLLLRPFTALLGMGTPLHAMLADYGLGDDQILGLASTSAGTISFLAAIASNFIWNRYWTYPDSRSKSFRRQFAQFVFVNVLGIFIRIPLMALTTPLFINLVTSFPELADYATRIGSNLALMLVVVIVMFWNFFANRYWTYSDVDQVQTNQQ